MKIASSTVAMAGQSVLQEQDVHQQSLRTWGRAPSMAKLGNGVQALIKRTQQDLVNISMQAQQLYVRKLQAAQAKINQYEPSDTDKLRLRLIQGLVENLTGKKINFVLPTVDVKQEDIEAQFANLQASQSPAPASPAQPTGWGLEYHDYSAHVEQEAASFTAAGVVKTADGQEIDFSVQLNMSRQFISAQQLDVKAGDALRDPLVINFAGAAAELTTNKFQFDLDGDGQAENMSFVKAGSGFLALDLNGDGVVNSGQELFGPKSGDGFADLAQYDADNNGWIDENDPIYQKLRIWTKDDKGRDQLLALGQAGVGAIYLGNAGTEFSVKDNNNELQGKVRSTGVFLKENGQVGTLQQVDLAI